MAVILMLGASAPAVQARTALPSFHNPVHAVAPRGPHDEPRPDVVLAGSFLFYEDFEHGTKNWRWSGGTAATHWLVLNAPTCGGMFTMLLGRPAQAPFNGEKGTAALTCTKPINLVKAHRPHLTYDVKASAEPDDGLTLQPEMRVVGGTWQPVGVIARARYQTSFTRFADLTRYAGKTVELRFTARFKPTAKPVKGFYLDNVQIIEPLGPAPRNSHAPG